MYTLLKIVILLGFLIFIHEFGHYIVAKKCKVKVNEFSIGFGKTLFQKEKNGTKYEIKLIPLGGFVSLEGEEESSDKEGSFMKASTASKIAIVAAGALVNIIFGIILYYLIIVFRYKIIIDNSTILQSIQYGFYALKELFIGLFQSIKELFTFKLSINDFTGPVGISNMVSKTNSLVEFLYLLSMISISLGITNLLPILPLDGGKILLFLIEKIIKKPIKKEVEASIQMLGMFLILTLSIVVTYNDIITLIKA